MRTTAVLVILMLAVGLNLGASMAQAGDNAVIQPLPSACQTVSDAELSQIQGKFMLSSCVQNFLCTAVRNFWQTKVPAEFRGSPLGLKLKAAYFNSCATTNGFATAE